MSRDGVFSCKTCFSFFRRLVLWFCWLLRAIRLVLMYKDGFASLKDELVMVGAWLPLGGRVWVRITMGQIGIGLAWRKCNDCEGMYRGK